MTLFSKRITTLLVTVGMLSLGGASAAIAKPANPGSDISTNKSQKRIQKRAKRKAKRDAKRQYRLAKFDTNRDGKLDKPERKQVKKQRFALLDANQDGGVTLEEMRKLRRQKQAGKFATLPAAKKARRQARRQANKGKRNARLSKRFAKRDIDGNGSITWGEFSKAKRQKRGQKRRRGFGRRGQKQS